MLAQILAALLACTCPIVVTVNPAVVGNPQTTNVLGEGTTNVYDMTRPGIGGAYANANLGLLRVYDGGNSDRWYWDTNPPGNGPAGSACAGNALPQDTIDQAYAIATGFGANVAIEANYGSD